MKRNIFATERRLDNNNRIVIPADFRTTLGWSTGMVICIVFRPLRKEIVLAGQMEEICDTGEKYTRRIDELGRFCVPVKFREMLNLPTGGVVRIECDSDTKEIRLTPPTEKAG